MLSSSVVIITIIIVIVFVLVDSSKCVGGVPNTASCICILYAPFPTLDPATRNSHPIQVPSAFPFALERKMQILSKSEACRRPAVALYNSDDKWWTMSNAASPGATQRGNQRCKTDHPSPITNRFRDSTWESQPVRSQKIPIDPHRVPGLPDGARVKNSLCATCDKIDVGPCPTDYLSAFCIFHLSCPTS